MFFIVHAEAQELVSSQIDPAAQQELDYAEALNNLGMPDYAEMVLGRLKIPGAKWRITVLEIQGLVARGKFTEAEARIKKEPSQESDKVWAMQLSLADGYYAWGKYKQAQDIYDSFFAAYPEKPPASLNAFYMNAAYKYGQMLLLMGDKKAALSAYKNVLKSELEKDIKRQITAEMAELIVKLAEESSDQAVRKQYFVEADKLCDELLWIEDLWFGKAIVMKAHMKEMAGDIKGAMEGVENPDIWERLKGIDERLRYQSEFQEQDLMKYSPMAECRFMLGGIMLKEAERLLASGDKVKAIDLLVGVKDKDGKRSGKGAYNHFLNVFIQYPSSPWAPDASEEAAKAEKIINKLGGNIKSNIKPEQMVKVEKAQFQEARTLYNQQQFDQASVSYLKVLNLFPETETSIAALSELTRCFTETGEDFYQETATRYIAERFSKNQPFMEEAGDQLLRLAEWYGERGSPEKKLALYDLFFNYFPKHPRTASKLYQFGDERLQKKDISNALVYYSKIKTDYINSPFYFDAMSKIAYCQKENGDKTAQVNTLTELMNKLTEQKNQSQLFVNAKFQLACVYKDLEEKTIPNAANIFTEIIQILTAADNPYQKSQQEKENNQTILEGSMFYKAQCFAKLTSPPDKLEAYKQTAIKTLDDLVTKYPKSQFAPAALNQIGVLWTLLNKPEEASKVLTRLQKEYPGTPEEKNSKFILAQGLMELGRSQEAKRIFKEMFSAGSGKYSDGQILTAGKMLLESGEYAIALDAFDRILAGSKENAMREAALLGKAKALAHLEKFDEATLVYREFFTKYVNSGYTVEAALFMSAAVSEKARKEQDDDKRFDLFNEAIKALQTAQRYSVYKKDAGTEAKCGVNVGRVTALKAEAEKEYGEADQAKKYIDDAIGTYQTLIMFADTDNPEIRPNIENAIHECTPLLIQTERWEDAVGDCEKYLKLFSSRGKYAIEVRNWLNQAQAKLAAQRAVETEPVKEIKKSGEVK